MSTAAETTAALLAEVRAARARTLDRDARVSLTEVERMIDSHGAQLTVESLTDLRQIVARMERPARGDA